MLLSLIWSPGTRLPRWKCSHLLPLQLKTKWQNGCLKSRSTDSNHAMKEDYYITQWDMSLNKMSLLVVNSRLLTTFFLFRILIRWQNHFICGQSLGGLNKAMQFLCFIHNRISATKGDYLVIYVSFFWCSYFIKLFCYFLMSAIHKKWFVLLCCTVLFKLN